MNPLRDFDGDSGKMANPHHPDGRKTPKCGLAAREDGLEKIGFGRRAQGRLLGSLSAPMRPSKPNTGVKFWERATVRMHDSRP